MSLYNGISYSAIAAGGSYTTTYGAAHKGPIANLAASRGLMEDAPNVFVNIIAIVMSYFRRRHA